MIELQRQVDEFIMKGYIRESMNPYDVTVLLVPLIIKYKHLISRFDDTLDELYRACIFSKIDLKMGNIRLG
jgi:hypothetical protein